MKETETAAQVERIREKVQSLALYDRANQIFGAGGRHGHGHRQRPCLGPPELERLEERFGVTLPDELRQFLTSVHGGGAGPGYGFFLHADAQRLPRRARPFPFDEEAARSIIERRLAGTERWAVLEMAEDDDEDDDDYWPPGPGFLPIAHHGCGVFDVIVVVGQQRGRIWCCDTRWFPRFGGDGQQFSFLAWYEDWLDSSLGSL